MLAKMVYKNMDKKNMLLYSFSIILSVALEMALGTAFMVNDRYGLNEKTGSMNWLCTMFFLAAGVMSIFFVLYSTAYYVRTKNKDYSLLLMLGSSRKSTMLDIEKPEFICLSEEKVFTVTKGQNEIVFGTEKPDCLQEFAILPEAVIADYQDEAYSIFAKKGSLQKEYEQYGYCFHENGMDIFWRCAFLKDADENMVYVKIISIFAGVFCIFSFFEIFALKLQGDMPLLNQKYRILYHIGMSKRSIYKAMSSEYRKLMEIPVVLSLLLSGVYMAAEVTGIDMVFEYFICKYIPFQIIFVDFNVMYFCWIKKMVLKKNTEIIMNE